MVFSDNVQRRDGGERKATGAACLEDGEYGHQHRETTVGAGIGTTQSALPTHIEFQIAIESPNSYRNGQNRGQPENVGLRSFPCR